MDFDKATAPQRLRARINKASVPFYTDDFYGDPADYNFNRLHSQYVILRDALARLNMKFTAMGARNITPGRAKFAVYVGDPDDALIIWEKYESPANGSGQNRIYINGMLYKMSWFVNLSPEAQEVAIEPCELRRMMRKTLTTEEKRIQHA